MEREASLAKTRSDPDGLATLLPKMADDLTRLLDTKLALLKIELKEELTTFVRGSAMIAAGGVLAVVGLIILNVAIACFIASLFSNTSLTLPVQYGLGFLITALIYIIVGGVLIVVNKNRIAEQDLVPPRTARELKKDKRRLEKEI